MPDLLTVQLTEREARALSTLASMFSESLAEENPEWARHVEDDGSPPALITAILALESVLMLCGS